MIATKTGCAVLALAIRYLTFTRLPWSYNLHFWLGNTAHNWLRVGRPWHRRCADRTPGSLGHTVEAGHALSLSTSAARRTWYCSLLMYPDSKQRSKAFSSRSNCWALIVTTLGL